MLQSLSLHTYPFAVTDKKEKSWHSRAETITHPTIPQRPWECTPEEAKEESSQKTWYMDISRLEADWKKVEQKNKRAMGKTLTPRGRLPQEARW
jgi:hypothetical protein